ncbi:MarR family transcriptional regulator [Sphingomonas sp. MMS24-J13]|uniref:MarR family transcriptional regulator n=1 Tax=Sphingomonas sp. MMS24-J13 TaxID=3238686 RepID=UPI00384BF7BA
MVLEDGGVSRPRAGEKRRNLLYAHLISLVVLANESGAIAYPRRLHMPDIVRQLIFTLGVHGSATSSDLVAASGREKAQISRGIKALSEGRLIDRPTTRGAITLNAAGERVLDDVLRIARERNVALCEGISDAELDRFMAMTSALIDRASAIFIADEKVSSVDLADRSMLHHPPAAGAPVMKPMPEGSALQHFVLPWLQSLMTYLRRSGDNLFLREVGMSIFEWRVLSQIEENQPVNLSQLIALLTRDKSQVARMVKKLTMAGQIERVDEGRANVSLTLTEAGRASYERICTIGEQRDSFMFADYAPEERAFYIAMMARLTGNARLMLEREKAAQADDLRRDGPGCAPSPAVAQPDVALLQAENARLRKELTEALRENAELRGSREESK